MDQEEYFHADLTPDLFEVIKLFLIALMRQVQFEYL